MKNILGGSECVQYADNSLVFRSCKIKNINKCSNEIENELNAVEVWSKEMNQVFNPNKTKGNGHIIMTDGAITPNRLLQQSKY